MIPGRQVSTFSDTAFCVLCDAKWEVTTRVETGLLALASRPEDVARRERLANVMRAQQAHRASCPKRRGETPGGDR